MSWCCCWRDKGLLNKLVLLWLGRRVEVTGASSPDTVSENAPPLLLLLLLLTAAGPAAGGSDESVAEGEPVALPAPPLPALFGVIGAPLAAAPRERLGGVGGC